MALLYHEPGRIKQEFKIVVVDFGVYVLDFDGLRIRAPLPFTIQFTDKSLALTAACKLKSLMIVYHLHRLTIFVPLIRTNHLNEAVRFDLSIQEIK